MLKEKSGKECAVLPEDTLQRILVGVSYEFIKFHNKLNMISEFVYYIQKQFIQIIFLLIGMQPVGDCLLHRANSVELKVGCSACHESSPHWNYQTNIKTNRRLRKNSHPLPSKL